MKLVKYIGFFVILFAAFGCENNVVSPIPNAPVRLEFNILQDEPQLNAVGGLATFVVPKYAYEAFGYGGVVVFHDFEDRLVAFDLACPNEVNPQIRLNVDSIVGSAICPKCGAVFDIGYGYGYSVSEICKYPMKKYNVVESNYNVRVFN